MSYAVVRVQKMTSGGVKGIEIHDLREKDHSNTNPDIDYDRTPLNYDLCPEQNQNFYQAVKERIEELNLPKAVRKDAIVLGQVLVTSDSDFFNGLKMKEQESRADTTHSAYASGMPFSPSYIPSPVEHDYTREFFERAYEYLADRYGRENIVSAVVHMDEGNPHMHFNFVPVTEDGRLCAKEVFSRDRLINQQDTFFEQVGKDYGLLRGETKDKGKRRKHLETPEYKEAMQMVAEARESLEAVKQEISLMETQKDALRGDIAVLEGQKQELEQVSSELSAQIHEAETELDTLTTDLDTTREELTITKKALASAEDTGKGRIGKREWDNLIDKFRGISTTEKLARFAEYVIAHVPGIREIWDGFEKAGKHRSKDNEITK